MEADRCSGVLPSVQGRQSSLGLDSVGGQDEKWLNGTVVKAGGQSI